MNHGTIRVLRVWACISLCYLSGVELRAVSVSVQTQNTSPSGGVYSFVTTVHVNGAYWSSWTTSPGQTQSYTKNLAAGNTVQAVTVSRSPVGGCSTWVGPLITYDGTAGSIMLVQWNPSTCSDPFALGNWTIKKCVKNVSGYSQEYKVFIDGTYRSLDDFSLPPGSQVCKEWQFADGKHNIEVRAVRDYYDEEGNLLAETEEPFAEWPTTDSGWYQQGGTVVPPTTSNYNGMSQSGSVDGSTGPIAGMGTGSDLAKESTLQAGFQGMAKISREGFAETVDALRSMKIGMSVTVPADTVLHGKVDLTNTKLGEVLTKLGVIQTDTAKIEQVNTYLQGVLTKLDEGKALEQSELLQLQSIGVAQGVGNDKLENIKVDLAALKGLQGQANAYLQAISQSGSGVDPRPNIDAVKSSTDAVKSSTDSVKGAVDQVKASTDAVKSSTDAVKGSVDGVKTSTDAVKAEVAGVRSSVDAINAKLGTGPAAPNLGEQQTAGEEAAIALRGAAHAIKDKVPVITEIEPHVSSDFWLVKIPRLPTAGNSSGYWEINCNPLQGGFGEVASKCKSVVWWFLTVGFLIWNWSILEKWMQTSTLFQQAKASGTSIAGTNINTAVALACAAAITLALTALPIAANALFETSVSWSGLIGNPFTGNGGMGAALTAGYALACAFVPVTYLLSQLMGHMVFRATVAGIGMVVSTVVRFIVG